MAENAAQKVLGHKRSGTTGDVYTDWDEANTRTTLSQTVPSSSLDEQMLRAASTTARERSGR